MHTRASCRLGNVGARRVIIGGPGLRRLGLGGLGVIADGAAATIAFAVTHFVNLAALLLR